jgi:Holliday junction resolvasome RuvABC endonuclease subunit
MQILALDPSILHCGWAVMLLEKNNVQVQAYGTIIAPDSLKQENLMPRIYYVLIDLERIRFRMAQQNFEISKIVIEKPQPWGSYKSLASSRSGSLEILTILTGAIAGWALTQYRPENVIFVPVSEWKGQLPKSATKRRMQRKYPGVVFKTTDEADAVGLGDWHLEKVKEIRRQNGN